MYPVPGGTKQYLKRYPFILLSHVFLINWTINYVHIPIVSTFTNRNIQNSAELFQTRLLYLPVRKRIPSRCTHIFFYPYLAKDPECVWPTHMCSQFLWRPDPFFMGPPLLGCSFIFVYLFFSVPFDDWGRGHRLLGRCYVAPGPYLGITYCAMIAICVCTLLSWRIRSEVHVFAWDSFFQQVLCLHVRLGMERIVYVVFFFWKFFLIKVWLILLFWVIVINWIQGFIN